MYLDIAVGTHKIDIIQIMWIFLPRYTVGTIIIAAAAAIKLRVGIVVERTKSACRCHALFDSLFMSEKSSANS
jgi:hypothetical protein